MSEQLSQSPDGTTSPGEQSAATASDVAVDASAAGQAPTPADDAADQPPLPLDEMFDLLQNQRRRYVLEFLEAADGEVTLSDLAEQIAAWENDKPQRAITSGERKRVYVGLYQGHLPKMDGLGAVSFNKPRGLIERGTNAAALETFLHRTDSPDDAAVLGPSVGPAVAGATLGSAAILLLSLALPAVLLALAVVVIATAAGVAVLRRGEGETDGEDESPPAPERGPGA